MPDVREFLLSMMGKKGSQGDDITAAAAGLEKALGMSAKQLDALAKSSKQTTASMADAAKTMSQFADDAKRAETSVVGTSDAMKTAAQQTSTFGAVSQKAWDVTQRGAKGTKDALARFGVPLTAGAIAMKGISMEMRAAAAAAGDLLDRGISLPSTMAAARKEVLKYTDAWRGLAIYAESAKLGRWGISAEEFFNTMASVQNRLRFSLDFVENDLATVTEDMLTFSTVMRIDSAKAVDYLATRVYRFGDGTTKAARKARNELYGFYDTITDANEQLIKDDLPTMFTEDFANTILDITKATDKYAVSLSTASAVMTGLYNKTIRLAGSYELAAKASTEFMAGMEKPPDWMEAQVGRRLMQQLKVEPEKVLEGVPEETKKIVKYVMENPVTNEFEKALQINQALGMSKAGVLAQIAELKPYIQPGKGGTQVLMQMYPTLKPLEAGVVQTGILSGELEKQVRESKETMRGFEGYQRDIAAYESGVGGGKGAAMIDTLGAYFGGGVTSAMKWLGFDSETAEAAGQDVAAATDVTVKTGKEAVMVAQENWLITAAGAVIAASVLRRYRNAKLRKQINADTASTIEKSGISKTAKFSALESGARELELGKSSRLQAFKRLPKMPKFMGKFGGKFGGKVGRFGRGAAGGVGAIALELAMPTIEHFLETGDFELILPEHTGPLTEQELELAGVDPGMWEMYKADMGVDEGNKARIRGNAREQYYKRIRDEIDRRKRAVRQYIWDLTLQYGEKAPDMFPLIKQWDNPLTMMGSRMEMLSLTGGQIPINPRAIYEEALSVRKQAQAGEFEGQIPGEEATLSDYVKSIGGPLTMYPHFTPEFVPTSPTLVGSDIKKRIEKYSEPIRLFKELVGGKSVESMSMFSGVSALGDLLKVEAPGAGLAQAKSKASRTLTDAVLRANMVSVAGPTGGMKFTVEVADAYSFLSQFMNDWNLATKDNN